MIGIKIIIEIPAFRKYNKKIARVQCLTDCSIATILIHTPIFNKIDQSLIRNTHFYGPQKASLIGLNSQVFYKSY